MSKFWNRISGKERKRLESEVKYLEGQVDKHKGYHNNVSLELSTMKKQLKEELTAKDDAIAYTTIRTYLNERFNIGGQAKRGVESMLNYIEMKLPKKTLKIIKEEFNEEV